MEEKKYCNRCQIELKGEKEKNFVFYHIYSEKLDSNEGETWDIKIRPFGIYLCESCWKEEKNKYLNKKYSIIKNVYFPDDRGESSEEIQLQQEAEFKEKERISDKSPAKNYALWIGLGIAGTIIIGVVIYLLTRNKKITK